MKNTVFTRKMYPPVFPKTSEKETTVDEIIHSIVGDLMRVASHGKKCYFTLIHSILLGNYGSYK